MLHRFAAPLGPELNAAVKSELSRGFALAVSGFGARGLGGFGTLGVDGFDVIDRVSTRGVACVGSTVVRAIEDRSKTSLSDSVATDVLAFNDGCREQIELSAPAGEELLDVVAKEAEIWVATRASNSVLRICTNASATAFTLDRRASCDDHDRLVSALAVVDGCVLAALPMTKKDLREGAVPNGRIIDLETEAVLVDGFTYPSSIARWRDGWVISEQNSNSLVVVERSGARFSIRLDGIPRGIVVVDDVALIATGRPHRLLSAADRVKYRVVAVSLTSAAILGEVVLPIQRLHALSRLPLP